MVTTDQMPQITVRVSVAIAVVSLGIAAFTFLLRFELEKYVGLEIGIVLLGTGMLGLFGMTSLLALYLRGAISVPLLDQLTVSSPRSGSSRALELELTTLREQTSAAIEQLTAHTSELQARMAAQSPPKSGSTVDMEVLIAGVRDHVTATLAAEIEARLEQRLLKDIVWRDTRQVFEASTARLLQEIGSLTRRANVNLLIGVVTTVIAVALLVYMVVGTVPAFTTWTELLSHYIPRLSTVIFIEIFSFFFLRLYRASLAEVKFYQNELTVLDTSRVALSTSHASADPKAILAVITALAEPSRSGSPPSSELAAGFPQVKEIAEVIERLAKVAATASTKAKGAKDSEA